MNKFVFLLATLFAGICATAQDTLPLTANIQHAVQNQTRSMTGAPGAKYWQNRADYTIDVSFNPETRLVSGTVKAVYKNNSPDTLRELWFKLYPNIYTKGNAPKDVKPEDLGAGVNISAAQFNHKQKDISSLIIDGTNMHTSIDPLLPGKSTEVDFAYSYTLNKGSHMRTGQVDSGAFFIAYFFPRIAVYDDIDGWNKYPYTGSYEFYNDFCRFKANITVPKNYVVWATGNLTNGKQVFKKQITARITEAEKHDAPAGGKGGSAYEIISEDDLAKNNVTQQKENRFSFDADNVTDFVFAISNHYTWWASSLVVDPKTERRTRVDAVFNPQHKDYYLVPDFAHKTVYDMSYRFPAWPYPYPHETVFDGLDQMEYPMMVNDNPTKTIEDEITLTDHEIFHTMFPFYMGINETKYGWMDEGWATIGEWLISPMIDSTLKDSYGIAATAKTSGEANDQPIMTLTPELKGPSGYTDSYPKPAFGYLFVKDYLGDSLFTIALHHYIGEWHGKHPTPYDFFNAINTGSGKNLNWFWNRWYFGSGVVDLAIKSVDKTANGYNVVVQNKSQKPLPVDVTVTYTDGSQGVFHKSIDAWRLGQETITIVVETAKQVKSVKLGSFYVPDKNPADNSYTAK